MTGLNLVLILLSFVLLYVLQLIYSKSMVIKTLVITYLFIIASGIYFAFDSYKGWATPEKLDEGYMVSAMVIEPNEGKPGAIYYWAVPSKVTYGFFSFKAEEEAPRAYSLPYSKKASQSFQNAMGKMQEGYLVKITNGEAKNNDQEGKAKTGEAGKKGADADDRDYTVPHLELISPDQLLRKAK